MKSFQHLRQRRRFRVCLRSDSGFWLRYGELPIGYLMLRISITSRICGGEVTNVQVRVYVTNLWGRRLLILDAEVTGCGVTDLWCRRWVSACG